MLFIPAAQVIDSAKVKKKERKKRSNFVNIKQKEAIFGLNQKCMQKPCIVLTL